MKPGISPRRLTVTIIVGAIAVGYGFWNTERSTRETAAVVRIVCNANVNLIEHDSKLKPVHGTVTDPTRIAIIRDMVDDLRRLPGDPCSIRGSKPK